MQFRTTITPLSHQGSIDHTTPVMLLGSCFSDNIGSLLRQALFPVMVNPFGTLYNPASIHAAIERIISLRQFTEAELIQHHGMYHSFMCHSSLSSADPQKMLSRINARLQSAHTFLKSASWMVVTLGSAWVYALRSTGTIVANCHKLPANEFLRFPLSTTRTITLLTQTINLLSGFNPSLRIILTVSPIRHLADGAHGNQISKSTLLLATDQLIESEHTHAPIYFPAYEIMMDDLRDYRFYAHDMCHPSDTAVQYIYQLFGESFFSPGTQQLAIQCQHYTRRLLHRPLTDDDKSHLAFVKATDNIRQQLISTYPFLEQAITQYSIDNAL